MSYKIRRVCLSFITLSVMMLNFQLLHAQNLSALDGMIEQTKKQFGGKLAVMVWKDTIVYKKFAGEDLTLNTQGPIGCESAWLTAGLTMTFVEQGKLDLDDPVAKYLPIYATYAKSYLTIRHCLANVTGIEPEKGGIQKIFQKTRFTSLEEEVNAIAKREIKNNPGEVFYYNNYGSNIVGRVLEIVGKKGFDRLMMERIFRPCGMKRSTFSSDVAINPFSGGVSTPADYIKFQAMLLNGGMAGIKKVLTPQSIAEMQKVQTGNAKNIFVPAHVQGYVYGLGNWIRDGVITSPSLQGGWAWIDTKKKYAVLVFGETKEDKKEYYDEIINAVDAGF
ncbi:MAG TPA: serine hydrolase domain-containing protein [Flavitalea sp.]|nr:serine hydrolase domain-containing protein [Flavitalea sp.]